MARRPGTARLQRASAAVWRFLATGFRVLGPAPWYPVDDTGAALVECAACGKTYACPVDWEPQDETHWWIRLRCGACETWRDVVVEDEAAAAFDRALGAQTAQIQRAVATLDRERMISELESFVAALNHDLIDASSFSDRP